jgi:uncharacterized membrane protein YozB (DUF420 family)
VTKDTESSPAPEAEHIRIVHQTVLPRLMRNPVLWLFIAVYVVALVLFIPAGGTVLDLLSLLIPAFYSLFIAVLVVPLTAGAPSTAWEEAAEAPRARLLIQLVVMAFFLALYVTLTVVIFSPGSVPGLGPFLLQHSELTMPLAVVSIPVVCLLPLVILRLLGVGFREMGLGRGYHAFRVAAVGCSVLAAYTLVALVSRAAVLRALPR